MIAAALVLAGVLGSSVCTFPGEAAECVGSRSGWVVQWREPSAGHDHELWLQRPGEAPIRLAEFGRAAEVLWSPDGEALAITDHTGSSDATAWVVRMADPTKREDLEAAFNRAFGRPTEVYRHGHRYFRARSWRSADALVFEVHAHDDTREGHRATFVYARDGAVRPIEAP
jgi:hypothetical protein